MVVLRFLVSSQSKVGISASATIELYFDILFPTFPIPTWYTSRPIFLSAHTSTARKNGMGPTLLVTLVFHQGMRWGRFGRSSNISPKDLRIFQNCWAGVMMFTTPICPWRGSPNPSKVQDAFDCNKPFLTVHQFTKKSRPYV